MTYFVIFVTHPPSEYPEFFLLYKEGSLREEQKKICHMS
jgi:hypothetical protein